MWSLKRDTGAESAAEDIKQEQQTALYWWWQYLWLSAVAMSTYVAECLFQLLPMLTTFLCTRDNDYLNAFLNLYFPLRWVQLYIIAEPAFGTCKHLLAAALIARQQHE